MKKTLGERIRELRGEADLSLRELSKKTGDLAAAFLSDIELGRRFPSEDTLARIAGALGSTVEDLQQYDSRPPIDEMKRRAANDPEIGLAFRTLAGMPKEELLKMIGKLPKDEGKK